MPRETVNYSNLVEVLRARADNSPEKTAYIFLKDGEIKAKEISYQELDRQARAIALKLKLKSLVTPGSRAVLIYSYNGALEFIAAFFGCLYAGVVAIPTHPPQNHLSINNLYGKLASSQAEIILTEKNFLSKLKSQLSNLDQKILWMATDEVNYSLAEEWQETEINKDNLAFLQYTSGSTGMPKGVMVTHECILHNQKLLKEAFATTENSIGVGWLPLFHDMGLIGNVIQAMYVGIPCIFMSPIAFIQKPFRWLKAICDYKATISGGPNFAYDLLCRQVTDKQKENLDLSNWELAFSGAEPVRAETMENFARHFADCGFRYEAFYPCYGMAEATLLITGGRKNEPPVVKYVKETDLEKNKVVIAQKAQSGFRPLVGCGRVGFDQKIIIVEPKSLTPCPDGKVGEIWVASPSVANGYWQQPEETAKTFKNYLQNQEEAFLRTGDLGFFLDGELFITGRLKDVLMFWGFSHYPHHLEKTVEISHPALRNNGGAAFAIDVEGEERLVIAQEVERSYRNCLDLEEIVETIRWTIFQDHFVDVYAIALLKPGGLPKTSSGKVQRSLCREKFLAGELNTLAQWRSPQGGSDITATMNRYLNPLTHLKRYSGLIRGRMRRFVYQIFQ
jgi:acyl-CoA synthetase (AMP-forming)/AMP-acid ligase II